MSAVALHSEPVEVSVPAGSQILFAGTSPSPDIRRCGDLSEQHSPVLAPISLIPDRFLVFDAQGAVGSVGPEGHRMNTDGLGNVSGTLIVADTICALSDGGRTFRQPAFGGILGPAAGMIGIFLGDTIAPEKRLPNVNYAEGALYKDVLRPALQEPFYIGSGFTRDGLRRFVRVPLGATRLYLGVNSSRVNVLTGRYSVLVDQVVAAPQSYNPLRVPAVSSLWLAGKESIQTPTSSSSAGFPTFAPFHAPVIANVPLNVGQKLWILAAGSAEGRDPNGAGGPGMVVFREPASPPLSGLNGPAGSLAGVFVGDSGAVAPAALSFATPSERDAHVAPLLNQTFFIGTGLTSTGERKSFTTPAGATALYLGLLSNNVGNNKGAFEAVVTVQTNDLPEVASGALVDTAAGGRGALAAGSLATLYGSRLSTGQSAAPTTPLPISLNNTEVYLGPRPIPLLYSSSDQINFQIPPEISIGTHRLVVTRDRVASLPVPIEVARSRPAIFSHSGGALIADAASGQLVTATQPVRRGDYIVVYANGLGPVSPTVLAGAASPADPVSRADSSVVARFGTRSTPVAFAGLAPGLVGVFQVNVAVPDNIESGDVAFSLEVDGQRSNEVRLHVRQ